MHILNQQVEAKVQITIMVVKHQIMEEIMEHMVADHMEAVEIKVLIQLSHKHLHQLSHKQKHQLKHQLPNRQLKHQLNQIQRLQLKL